MSEFPIDANLIVQHIQDGLLIVGVEGRVMYANEIFLTMVGRSREDVIGRPCCELEVGAFCREHCPVTGSGSSECAVNAHFNVQVDSTLAGGRSGAYCFVTSPLHDDDGRLIGFMENFRGMDRVRDVILQLEEVVQAIDCERQKTEDLIDSLADGVFSVDQDLVVRRFSSNMEQMLGIPADRALGRRCRDVLRGTLCDTDCPLVWSRAHGKAVTGCREELTLADGRTIPVQISTGFLRNEPDFERGLFGVVTDRSELEKLRHDAEVRDELHGMIGRAPAMRSLFRQIEAVAPTNATVLISGESGTGKELVARALHLLSLRAAGPFIGVNCAALVEDLLASELFGHVRGAFTGALRDQRGRFEQAEGGTLFLDEIGDTSLAMQAKLLRALQERVIEPVGAGSSRRVDVRVIAATNKDLAGEVQRGAFRDDLLYRLNVIPIHVPPLRERKEDVPLLIEHFIQKYRRQHFAEREELFDGISERALALMSDYPWPGNVRELEHAVEYAMISSDRGRIERCFLPLPLRQHAELHSGPIGPSGADEGRSASVMARSTATLDGGTTALQSALDAHRWNIGATAITLGISRTTLWRRMRAIGLSKAP